MKMHMLKPHLDFFFENLSAVGDERGERFRRDISSTEKKNYGNWSPGISAKPDNHNNVFYSN